MCTVWHVDKYKITFKLVIKSRRISRGPVAGRGPAVEKHCFSHLQYLCVLQEPRLSVSLCLTTVPVSLFSQFPQFSAFLLHDFLRKLLVPFACGLPLWRFVPSSSSFIPSPCNSHQFSAVDAIDTVPAAVPLFSV